MNNLNGKTMLIGIGAQKAGTTWLFDYLDNHPEVYMSHFKEMHIFDYRHVYSPDKFRATLMSRIGNTAQTINNKKGIDSGNAYARIQNSLLKASMIDNVERYIEYFQHRVSDQSIFGEITPAYSLLPKEGYQEILTLHPDIKFIFIMRDPIKRAWSHVNYAHSRRGLSSTNEERLGLISREGSNEFFLKSNYEKMLSEMDQVIPKENLLSLFFENLFEESTIKKICDFLSIDYMPASLSKNVNRGRYDYVNLYENHDITTRYQPIYKYCRQRFGDEVPQSWWVG